VWGKPGETRAIPQPIDTAAPVDDDAILVAAKALGAAKRPMIICGGGAQACADEVTALSAMLQAPVLGYRRGRGVLDSRDPLSVTLPLGRDVWGEADVVLGIGCSFTRHGMAASIPAGKTIIHATNDERDLNKSYVADHPLLGDARLVLRQLVEAVEGLGGRPAGREGVRAEIEGVRAAWLAEWAPILGSAEVPMTPYRVMAEFMRAVDPREAIVTHDSGSPRDQLLPFYRAVSPRGYLGWGKSHALGTGLGLIIGAKLAAPDKLCVNFMGDAAFGMTGLDFETAVRCGVPILTVVLNNSAMAIEIPHLVVSHDKYGARDIGGHYAELGRAMGGWSERVEKPGEIAGAFARARKATESGQAALLEFITSQETRFSHRGALR
jgi:thiamine pyrophosphate-dependent acetolactate synthase large subunit-like protein